MKSEQKFAGWERIAESYYQTSQQELKQSKQVHKEAENNLSQLQNKLNQSYQESLNLRNELVTEKEENNSLKSKFAEQTSELSKEKANNQTLQNRLTALKEDLASKDKTINELTKLTNQLQAEKDEKTDNIKDLTKKIGQLENEKIFLKNKLDKEKSSHQETQTELRKIEQRIIHEINITLKLGLQTPTLKQLIVCIQELINKDPLEQTQDSFSGENLEVIKELDLRNLEKLFPNQLSNDFCEQIKKAISYEQLVNTRSNFIQEYLSKNLNSQQVTNQSHVPVAQENSKERVIWIVLLLINLLTIVGLLIRTKRKNISRSKVDK